MKNCVTRSHPLETRARAEEIKRLLSKTLGPSFVEAGEEPFHFIQELSGTRVSKLRDPNRKAAEDEVDLNGWTLVESGQPGNVVREPLEQFQAYLQSAFDCPTSLHPELRSRTRVALVVFY